MSSTETVAFTVRMPKPMVDALDKIARRERSTRTHELFIAARNHVEADKRSKR